MNPHEHAIIERLIRNLSHEIRNPMTTIKGYAQLASMNPDDREAHKKSQAMILAQVEKINGLLEELYRIFSSPSDGREQVDARVLLDEAIGMARDEGARARAEGEGPLIVKAHITGLKKLIGALVLGYDWKHNPGTVLRAVCTSGGAGDSISFRYEGTRFDDLAPDTFFLPCATRRHFLSMTHLYEVAVIACTHGWDLRLSHGDDGSALDLVF